MHVHEVLDQIVLSYQVGIEVGANDRAFHAFDIFCQLSFLSGKQLIGLETNFEFCSKRLNIKLKACASAHQAVLNLRGKGNPNPANLTRTSFDINTLETDTKRQDFCGIAQSSLHGAVMAYLFHDFGRAQELISKYREYRSYLKTSYFLVTYALYEGLIALSVAKESVWKHCWRTVANESIEQFRVWSAVFPEGYQNKLSLLEAEFSAFTGQNYKAKYFYNMAVESSSACHFTHEEALVCERYGMFYLESRNEEMGLLQLSRALRCYSYWGAKSKVDHILASYPELGTDKNYVPLELDAQSDNVTAVSDLTANTGSTSGSSEKKVRFLHRDINVSKAQAK